ncbi:cysteine desulfurase family protein [Holzapfeliella floricola]|uniref:cysteine desulfurase family protein n=1 Tax=Holzapfeliella floricola TaxID=679249 RepID=UPI000A7D3348|nr:cysteine desulfurase family protein [Holzapfeliella floricola]
MNSLYFDNAATTAMRPEVIEEMTDKMTTIYGNASSTHEFGRQAKKVLDDSREILAKSINATDKEIIITSGGTESNNMALRQVAQIKQNEGNHIISTVIEHPSVLRTLEYLEGLGFEVTYLPVNLQGNLSTEDVKSALRPDTILVSLMSVNNETGAKLPIHEIGELLKDHQAVFHTDAVQSYGLDSIDVRRDHIDLLSTSAHKINGPKFIGFLYLNKDIFVKPLILGGEQESKRRAGTENVPAIAGFAKAVSLLDEKSKQDKQDFFKKLTTQLLSNLKENHVAFEVNGQLSDNHSYHVLNLWIKGVETSRLQMNLDLNHIAVSGGSACSAGSLEPSHVLTAMYGENSSRVNESIRISFGEFNTESEVEALSNQVVKISSKLLTKK